MATTATKKAATKKRKYSRIDLRVTPEQKDLLEQAASLAGLSLSAYMLSQCLKVARENIEDHQRLVLSDRDRSLFLSLIENPPEPCQDLKSAMKRFQDEYEN